MIGPPRTCHGGRRPILQDFLRLLLWPGRRAGQVVFPGFTRRFTAAAGSKRLDGRGRLFFLERYGVNNELAAACYSPSSSNWARLCG
jgi:hypothetical protein